MRFAFTDDQLLFRDTVRTFLAKECPPEQVRDAWINDDGLLPDVWAGLAEMGVIGMLVPERFGGMGMNELDLVLLFEEAGRAAVPGLLVDTVAVGAPLLAESTALDHDDELGAWLAELAGGNLLVATVLGSPLVAHAAAADVVVLEADGDVVAVPATDLTCTDEPSVDGSRRLFDVAVSGPSRRVLARGPDAIAARDRAFDRGALATAAQLLGLADRMLELTVDYVKQREQFGAPIGSFQAVKHHLADALLGVSFAKPAVYNAAYSIAHRLPECSRDVSMAKVLASDAAIAVARQALQCHGAIGYTVEYDLHLFMKRAWALTATWGDAAWHRDRVGVALGI